MRSSLSSGVLPMEASRDPAAGVAQGLVREACIALIVGIWCMSVKISTYGTVSRWMRWGSLRMQMGARVRGAGAFVLAIFVGRGCFALQLEDCRPRQLA
jgi:hypothetical protein